MYDFNANANQFDTINDNLIAFSRLSTFGIIFASSLVSMGVILLNCGLIVYGKSLYEQSRSLDGSNGIDFPNLISWFLYYIFFMTNTQAIFAPHFSAGAQKVAQASSRLLTCIKMAPCSRQMELVNNQAMTIVLDSNGPNETEKEVSIERSFKGSRILIEERDFRK